MNPRDLASTPASVWRRIDKIVAQKYDGNYAEFARRLGFTEPRIKNPKYRKTIPKSLIDAIKKELDISSDFILYGDANPLSIPGELLQD